MANVLLIAVLLSAVGSGIMAGVFFIFSNTVMNALRQLPSSQGIAAMQNINRVILNPLFFAAFIGTAVISALLAVSIFWFWGHQGAVYILIGALIYLIGSFLVTIAFNVPMNKALDALSSDADEAANLWARYLTDWTAWNHVRTVACLLSAVFFIFGFRYW